MKIVIYIYIYGYETIDTLLFECSLFLLLCNKIAVNIFDKVLIKNV